MFDKLKGLAAKAGLVEEVPDNIKEVVTPAPAVQAAPAPNFAVIGGSNEELAAAIVGNIKVRIVNPLYFQLLESVEKMKAAKLDEPSAVKGSAAMLGVSSITVANAVDDVINEVKAELVSFETNDYKAMVDNANTLNAQAGDLESQINAKLEEVRILSEQKSALLEQAAATAADAANKLSTFTATAGKLVSSYEAEKAKLQTYLS